MSDRKCFVALGLVVGVLAVIGWTPDPENGGWCLANSAAAAEPALAGQVPADDGKLRIICFAAHPDDAEFRVAGVAAMWTAQGHHVKLVSMTNGDAGHFTMGGGALARKRSAEVHRAAEILGVETEVLDIHDGELLPTLENRRTVVRLIREWQADIVMTHRPWDYHPDHRYAGQLVQDAAFVVASWMSLPLTKRVDRNPVFLFYADRFQKPVPFEADIAVSIDKVFQKKIDAVLAIESQFFETVYNVDASTAAQRLAQLPKDPAGRRAYVKKRFSERDGRLADTYRDALVKWYGPEKGKAVKYAEVFEICQYGYQPTDDEIKELFPFFPK